MSWWVVGLRGAAAILFGAVTFMLPAVTLAVLVALFGAYALVDGFFKVATAVHHRGDRASSSAPLVGGLVGIAAGIVTFVLPGLTELALLYVIAAWAILGGIVETAAAWRFRRRSSGEGWLGLNGVLSIVFGVLTMLMPGAGAISVAWLIGLYAIIVGALLLRASLRLRHWAGRQRPTGIIPIGPAHGG